MSHTRTSDNRSVSEHTLTLCLKIPQLLVVKQCEYSIRYHENIRLIPSNTDTQTSNWYESASVCTRLYVVIRAENSQTFAVPGVLWRVLCGECGVECGECGVESVVWRVLCGECCVESVVWRVLCGECCVESVVWRVLCGVLCGECCVESVVWRVLCGECCVESVVWRVLCGECCVESIVWSVVWSVVWRVLCGECCVESVAWRVLCVDITSTNLSSSQ